MRACGIRPHRTSMIVTIFAVVGLALACTCRLPAGVAPSPTPYPTYTPYDTYTPVPTLDPPTDLPPTGTPPPTATETPKPTRTRTPTPTVTPWALIVTMFDPIFPTNDLVLEDVFLSTQGEVIARVANQPAGGFNGSVTYQVFADGVLVATRSEGIPHGSQAFWSGYKVVGQQSIRVVLDSGGAYWEANEGNNEKTKTCSAAATACW